SFLQGVDFGLAVSLALLELGVHVLQFEDLLQSLGSATAFLSLQSSGSSMMFWSEPLANVLMYTPVHQVAPLRRIAVNSERL
ncbi:hypothetical protein INR49_030743, partial [Caranx melampygus]